ncbi:MAG TPA: SRPBCC family protein [Opitutaceae bacterium]|nr:SRPBCC family protein [Opitutaceae bacterium]
MIKIILLVLAATVVLILVLATFQPAEFRVTRSATLAAPASAVFSEINDFHRWQAWSPWEKMDTNLKRTFEGPASGMGSIYSWEGNKKVGSGRMTIAASLPSELIRIRLEFLKPWESTCVTEFTFGREGSGTLVTWTMSGPNSFMAKLINVFTSMDKMIGSDFEKGLANLKSAVESK